MLQNNVPAVICKNCALYRTAQVLGLESPDCSSLDQVVIRNHPIHKNEILYAEGDAFRYLYLVHSGSCISHATLAGENRQIMGFYLPGEIAGIEDIGQGRCSHTIRALETGSVCQLDFTGLDGAITPAELIRVQHYLLQAAATHSRLLQRERALSGLPSAEQRVAAFLLNLSSRFQAHGLPADAFRLPMSREEIASYLGLAMETVIRALKQLERKRLLDIKAKQVRILNVDAMQLLSAA